VTNREESLCGLVSLWQRRLQREKGACSVANRLQRDKQGSVALRVRRLQRDKQGRVALWLSVFVAKTLAAGERRLQRDKDACSVTNCEESL
jgi:hypothetical protein